MRHIPLDKATWIALSGFLLAMPGCSGSPSSESNAPPPDNPPPSRASFSELKQLGQELALETADTALTPEANIPLSGTASYKGAAAYRETGTIPEFANYGEYVQYMTDNPQIVSDVTLTADFGASTIGGQFSNFQDVDAGPLNGSIELKNASIVGGNYTGDLSGAIGPTGDVRDTTGVLYGVFGGDTAEYTWGDTFLDVGTGLKYLPLDGVFTAKK